MRARLDALERERADEIARAHQAVAAAQDRSYWLDRWHLDLNALMRKRGASELRGAVRALRACFRLARRAARGLADLPSPARRARRDLERP